MKQTAIIINLMLALVAVGLTVWCIPAKASVNVEAAELASLKKSAYDLYERGQYADSADAFRRYLVERPNDGQATFDYAALLSRLDRHAEAVELLEQLHRLDPARETAYFKLGGEYVLLKRYDDAARVFAELGKSSNRDMAQTAREASQRLKNDLEHAARFEAEKKVFDAARDMKWTQVVESVKELEKQGPPGFSMEMQLLYALVNLQQYTTALARAEKLAAQFPKATDLALLRADLFMQLGRKDEAIALWRQVERVNPSTDAATVASNRLAAAEGTAVPGMASPPRTELPVQLSAPAVETSAPAPTATAPAAAAAPPLTPSAEETIFELARQQRYREAVEAIDQLEQLRGKLDWTMQMQRLYALQALGDTRRAVELAGKMSAQQPQSVELAMMRADMLVSLHRWEEASAVLKEIRAGQPGTPVATEADRRLKALPTMANLDKWQWGDTYISGEYHSRFDALVGSGMIREGTYIPHARWLQPYAAFRFTVDTLSSGANNPQSSVIADNSVSLLGGLRVQPFATEYFFFYFETGFNKDLLDRRHGGDWAWDYQAGVNGFKSWGPGNVFLDLSRDTNACAATWRGDWFVDVGADFSYYYRFSSWIGYGQVHEGFRLAQFGRNLALDAFAVENIAWDVRGNYYDNLFEIGPGARLIWTPWPNFQVVLRTEWVKGWYFGRDDMNSRGNAARDYDDFRVSLSMGASW
jgi:tetratricopeptide (TPR) repeat protein